MVGLLAHCWSCTSSTPEWPCRSTPVPRTAAGPDRPSSVDQSGVHRARRRVLGVPSAPGATFDVTTDASGVTARWTVGDGEPCACSANPRGRDATEVVEQVLSDAFPDSRGGLRTSQCQPGVPERYGIVADFPRPAPTPAGHRYRGGQERSGTDRCGGGPIPAVHPEFGPGPPSPAKQIAQVMGKYVDSFNGGETRLK